MMSARQNTQNTMEIAIGDVFDIYYNTGNPNNTTVEIKALFDDQVAWKDLPTGRYFLDHVYFFEMRDRDGYLRKV